MNPTTTRPATLHVHADHLAGPHRTDSDDFVHWWAPSVGPSATLVARLLARSVNDTGTATWDTADLATRIGLGSSVNRLWATLERLAYFRAVTFVFDRHPHGARHDAGAEAQPARPPPRRRQVRSVPGAVRLTGCA
jgi:hypothetical protein